MPEAVIRGFRPSPIPGDDLVCGVRPCGYFRLAGFLIAGRRFAPCGCFVAATLAGGVPVMGLPRHAGFPAAGCALAGSIVFGCFLLRAGPGFWGISVTSSSLRPFPGPPGHLPSAVPMRKRVILQFLPSHRTRQAHRIFRALRRAFRRRREGGRGECGR